MQPLDASQTLIKQGPRSIAGLVLSDSGRQRQDHFCVVVLLYSPLYQHYKQSSKRYISGFSNPLANQHIKLISTFSGIIVPAGGLPGVCAGIPGNLCSSQNHRHRAGCYTWYDHIPARHRAIHGCSGRWQHHRPENS